MAAGSGMQDAAAVDASVSGGPPPVISSGYRPFLDGIRAIAVYLVVLFHAGSDRFVGGFIGVDVFFVLSGYLVTQLLVRDIESHGSIRLTRFYARRFRRLLPASFLALVVTAAVVTVVFTPAEVVDSLDSFRAASLYWANWYFIDRSADYFGDQIAQSPVLHFWSLAVEEQFYILWPLLLTAILALATRVSSARRWATARALIGAGALASVTWAVILSRSSPNHAYYGTDARAYQLLAGALLALSPGLIGRFRALGRFAAPLTWSAMAGLVVLATWVVTVGPVRRGIAVTALTVVLIVGLEASEGRGVLARVLSRPTLVYLGRISYGTYLWHWPVILVTDRLVEIGDLATAAVAAVVATALAALSFVLVETPIRKNEVLHRFAPIVVVTGLAVSLVAALVIFPSILDSGRTSRDEVASVDGLVPVPADFDQVAIKDGGLGDEVSCLGRAPDVCTVREGTGPHLLLLGDSVAVTLSAAFREVADELDLTLSLGANRACSWILGLPSDRPDSARCDDLRDDMYERVLPALDPDLVVVVDVLSFASVSAPDFEDDRATNEVIRERLLASVDQLVADGRDLLILEPLPRTVDGFDPLTCLATASFVEECRFPAPGDSYWQEDLERELAAERDDVWTLDLDRAACPLLPICDPSVDGTVVWWDDAHLTHDHVLTLVDDIVVMLKAEGLVPAP